MSDTFELQSTCKANNVIPVYKYKSRNTGLTVVIAQVEGPLVNGYFCLGKLHELLGWPLAVVAWLHVTWWMHRPVLPVAVLQSRHTPAPGTG